MDCASGDAKTGRPPPQASCSDKGTLFDHLIGAGEQCWRQIEAKGLCGPRIDDQIKLGWLLDWKIGRLRPAQNLVDIVGGAPKQVRDVCSLGHETTRFDVGPL